MSNEKFLLEYEKLLDKGYCNCNEMNCIDNNSPRRILMIANKLQQENQELNEKIDMLINNVAEYEDECNKYKKVIDKTIEYIESHKRKDEFLELNEWQTRDLLDILKR